MGTENLLSPSKVTVWPPPKLKEGPELPAPAPKPLRKKPAPSVFESAPQQSVADVRADADALRRGSLTQQARELIKAAEEVPAPCVFESQPRQTSADASVFKPVAYTTPTVFESQPLQAATHASARRPTNTEVTSSNTVFESAPAPSCADVAHGEIATGSLTASANALIQAAALEMDESGEPAGGVFESQPRPSQAAAAAHVAPCQSSNAPVVFESAPSLSKADALHGGGNLTAAAKDLIEKAALVAEEAPLEQGGSKSGAAQRAKEAEALIQTALTANEGCVFESEPAKSVAAAKHGEALVESSEEESESDDEAKQK